MALSNLFLPILLSLLALLVTQSAALRTEKPKDYSLLEEI